jgi:hypothetical protein
MTSAGTSGVQPGTTEIEPGSDQAHERVAERPQYRVRPQDDGGVWRGPTDAAWTTRILRGSRPPRPSAPTPAEAPDPHG